MTFLRRLCSCARPSRLHRLGVLGMNARNARFVLGGNPRSLYPCVDDKLLTKRICEERGIPVPATYAVLERQGDVALFPSITGDRRDFVIKPAAGAGGRGIFVVSRRDESGFEQPSGKRATVAEMRYFISTIISGLYSLGGQGDKVIIEQRIVRDTIFDSVAVGGTPDIRIILYRCVPVMAMVRLPTRASNGRANLHQGAAAAGIDLRSGRTIGGVWRNRAIATHPDTGTSIQGIEIPAWAHVLRSSMRLSDGIGMGYLGVDFVVDGQLGPVVLEANARPGLAIQTANRCGLLPRLEQVDRHGDGLDEEARMALAMTLGDS